MQVVLVDDKKWGSAERDLLYQVCEALSTCTRVRLIAVQGHVGGRSAYESIEPFKRSISAIVLLPAKLYIQSLIKKPWVQRAAGTGETWCGQMG